MSPEPVNKSYFPDNAPVGAENLNEYQRTLLYFSDTVTAANLGAYIRRGELSELGYRDNFLDTASFAGGKDGHINRARALVEITGDLGCSYDGPALIFMMTTDVRKDRTLNSSERKEAIDFIEGATKTINYYNRLKEVSGSAELFVATKDQMRGACVETNESDRLNMRHLQAIIKQMPEVSDAIARLDAEYTAEFNMDNPSTWIHRSIEDVLNGININIPGDTTDKKKENTVKLLARAWYELLGMPDLRAFQHRDQIIRAYMPEIEVPVVGAPRIKEFREKFVKEGKDFDMVAYYKGIALGYNSVLAFEMAPDVLMGGILKNNKAICEEIRSVALHVDQSTEHNSFNLGWMPAGNELLNAMFGKDGIRINELHNYSLSQPGKQLKDLTPLEWKNITDNVDWQKTTVTNLAKVDKAKVAFLQLFSGKPEAIEGLFGAVAAYLRASPINEKDHNPWTRAQILPMLSSAVIRVFDSYSKAGNPRIDRATMKGVLSRIEEAYFPDIPFNPAQVETLVGKNSLITKDFSDAAMYKG